MFIKGFCKVHRRFTEGAWISYPIYTRRKMFSEKFLDV